MRASATREAAPRTACCLGHGACGTEPIAAAPRSTVGVTGALPCDELLAVSGTDILGARRARVRARLLGHPSRVLLLWGCLLLGLLRLLAAIAKAAALLAGLELRAEAGADAAVAAVDGAALGCAVGARETGAADELDAVAVADVLLAGGVWDDGARQGEDCGGEQRCGEGEADHFDVFRGGSFTEKADDELTVVAIKDCKGYDLNLTECASSSPVFVTSYTRDRP